jgi:hypothetical protein
LLSRPASRRTRSGRSACTAARTRSTAIRASTSSTAPAAPVLAPVDATVGNRIPDFNAPAERETIQLRYPGVPQDYLIDITNLINVPSSVQAGLRVTRGQVIGAAGPMAIVTNVSPSAMIHFGLSDPNTNEPNIAPHTVSPDRFLTPEARRPACRHLAERGVRVGMVRASMNVGWSARPTTVDFTSSTGSRRLGLYDIVSETMRLSLGAPGTSRPASFTGASTYFTQK